MAESRQTLMVTEKPSQMRNIAPYWQECFPNDILTHFHTPPMGSFRFRLPRNLPISDVPIVADPVFERRIFEDAQPIGMDIFGGDFGALARAADHIVCATDNDPAGCRNFMDLMIQYRVEMPLSKISWLALTAEDPQSVRAGIDKGLHADHRDFAQKAAIGKARQYFNHLYALNALPVFGLTLRAAGIDPSGKFGFLSKYCLQTLLLLARTETQPLRRGEIHRLMRDNPASKVRSPIGTPASREALLNWLEQGGCISSQAQGKEVTYTVSDRGRRLVGLIHKDCFDPQLCIRLDDWGAKWPESKSQIDRYIRTFFGKQKRYIHSKIGSTAG